MPISLVLLLGLTLATCVIAYWSDNLGKKLGKKRISLFGVRPRLTATIISMASSVAITWFTLGVMLLVFPLLRDALLRYERVNRNNQLLLRQNASLTLLQSGLRSKVRQSTAQATASQREARKAGARLGAAKARMYLVGHQLHGLETRLVSAQVLVAAARRREATATRAARAMQVQLRADQNRLAQVRLDLGQARSGLKTTRAQLASARHNLAISARNLATEERSVATMLGSVGQLEQKVAAREADVARLEKREQAEGARVKELTAAQSALEIEIAARSAVADKAAAMGGVAAGEVMVSLNTVLASRDVQVPITSEAARAVLDEMMKEGDKAARELGAPAKLARLPVDPEQRYFLNEAELLTLMTGHLASSTVPLSIRLVTTRSHAVGEPQILCRFETIPISRAFSQGDIIASSTVDGAQSEARIFNQLLALMKQGQDVAANQHGVTPVPTPDEPNIYASGTNERIFEALHRIENLHGKADVRLTAATDISNVEPMHVRFEVKAL